jgi:putative tryptophan/tyrosine transport system substrate-binding protein
VRRRELIKGIAGSLAAWPLAARAQERVIPTVGVLYGVSAAEWADQMAGFHQGLSEIGFVESRNVLIEYRWAEGHLDRMHAMATDLIERRVAVLLVGGSSPGVRDVMATTQTIPIVFTSGIDPIAAGLVASLNRPGGNVTGITLLRSELGPKKLGLLRDVVPGFAKIAILINPYNQLTADEEVRGVRSAARDLRLEVVVVNGGSESEVESAFKIAVQQGATAIFVGADAFLTTQSRQIAELGLRYKLPTISSDRRGVRLGQFMSYGTVDSEMYRLAGLYVGRILKGEKPGDLPVIQPTKFVLSINLKTAKALGLTVPDKLLATADEVVE